MANQTPPNSSEKKPHIVLVPLMAQGHMIPMTDMARVFATHGATVTFITTTVNAARISTVIARAKESGLPITFTSLPFPAVEAGLPEGVENIDMLPSRQFIENFADACCLLREPLVQHLRNHPHPPCCIIADHLHHWTQEVAQEFKIRRFVFHGYGSFPLLCFRNIDRYNVYETIEDENEPFIIPGLPDSIEMTKAKAQRSFAGKRYEVHRERMKEAEVTCDGLVCNSFKGLEPLYPEWCGEALGKKVWTIGPLSLWNTDKKELASRGDKASIDEDRCLKWLDSMRPSSVVYVSFGSINRPIPSQLIEIGLGLEASNCPFIWVIKAGERFSEIDEWLSNFEERTRDRGLIIIGWAPQVLILSHRAVGGFVTHCGWNSTLESASFGVPMITWPHFGDQFLNEKLILQVLGIGVAIGVDTQTKWGVGATDVLVKKDDVDRAIKRLFDEGEEGQERRKRANMLREMARKAVEGGSSHENLLQLIQYVNE